SFWVLTLAIRASRTGNRRLWLACGALIPFSLLVAVEFAVYAAGAALVAIWIAREARVRALVAFAAGAAASARLTGLVLAVRGLLGAFVRTTFVFLPTLAPAYAMPLVRPALPGSSTFPNLLAWASDRTMFLYAFVVLAVVLLGAFLPLGARVRDRARVALPVLAWIVLAMVSVVERRHVSYPMYLVPLALVLLALWFKAERRWTSPRGLVAAAALAAVVVLWKPLAATRRLSATLVRSDTAGHATFDEPRRARGGRFPEADARLVRATGTLIHAAELS